MKIRYAICLLFVALVPMAVAQTFKSGSTGADGDLTYATAGTYTFDPKAFSPPLNPAGDGIFNFKNITIAAGVTLKLTGAVFNGPVVWLAQGPVQIDGTIDLSGQDAFAASNTTQRTYTIPGPGGYPGGYPAVGSNPPGPGLGPNAGDVISSLCGDNRVAGTGSFTGNQFIVPLIGGSGGGAHGSAAGGAGGGVILIASSVSISGAGSIKANGGAGSSAVANVWSGAGAGGGIRLVAPTVSLTGSLNASQGTRSFNACQDGNPGNGVVRVEAYTIGSLNASGTLYTATPFGLFLSSAGQPSIRVTSVGGFPVATSPTGTFTMPDVTVNSNLPLTFAIQASNIPLGTTATLTIFSENGPDQNIQSSALVGSLASSTATATATLPSGFSKGYIKATFTQ